MNFKNFPRSQFSKLRNGINGVGEFRYDTICSQNFVSIAYLVWKLLEGTKTVHRLTRTRARAHTRTHARAHTHTHTHTHTHRHTRRPILCLVFLRKCRNKTKNRGQWGMVATYWNLYRKFLIVWLQNLMNMEHFENYILTWIKKIISRKILDQ